MTYQSTQDFDLGVQRDSTRRDMLMESLVEITFVVPLNAEAFLSRL